ncbi:MAG TPA: transposase [Lacipirellulaceae bacterium]|nr:transposase [Lacipirellulaceae bacterium]HMP05704.1 transposase [Lacipirellulaceae bacterium]
MASYRDLLRHLEGRGLCRVWLVASDKCLGLVDGHEESCPEANWQRCKVDWYRNVSSVAPQDRIKEPIWMWSDRPRRYSSQ